jgi:hypothetical protein
VVHADGMEKEVGAGQGGELSLSLCAITEGREGIENGGTTEGETDSREEKEKGGERVRVGEGDGEMGQD